MFTIHSEVEFGCLHHRIETQVPEAAFRLYEKALNDRHEPEFSAADHFFAVEFYASAETCRALVSAIEAA